jgi:hypothetical protein
MSWLLSCETTALWMFGSHYYFANPETESDVEGVIGPIRLQNRISALAPDSVHDRSSLFEAALMHGEMATFVNLVYC